MFLDISTSGSKKIQDIIDSNKDNPDEALEAIANSSDEDELDATEKKKCADN